MRGVLRKLSAGSVVTLSVLYTAAKSACCFLALDFDISLLTLTYHKYMLMSVDHGCFAHIVHHLLIVVACMSLSQDVCQ